MKLIERQLKVPLVLHVETDSGSRQFYDLKILLQTENEDINELMQIFKSIKSKKFLIIPTSLTGDIQQGRLKRALRTIWNSRILYLYEPFLILKLFIKLILSK